MNLRFRYFLFIFCLHFLIAVLLFQLLKGQGIYILICEAILLFSLYLSFKLYRAFIHPIELMRTGRIAIREQDFTMRYNHTGAREIDELIDVYNSMIDSLREERTRTEEQAYFLESLIERSPVGMIIMDYDDRVEIINEEASMILGCQDAIGKPLSVISGPLMEAIRQLDPNEEKTVKIHGASQYKCRLHELMHKGFPRQFLIIYELTNELLQAEKDAYGRVIRMMAHEVNNSTGAINSILQSLEEIVFENTNQQFEESQELREILHVAIERNNNLGKFTNNFADIIRLSTPNLERCDLHQILDRSVRFYQIDLQRAGIAVELQLVTPALIIQADQLQMEQVISNILKNALESIVSIENADYRGLITISTNNKPRSLTISDNGEGIDPGVADRLFGPFFSTKTNGQGIGLMLCREVLNAHGFTFQLQTNPLSKVTSFVINF